MKHGGAEAILNSKSKFDRCKIPRLVLEELNEEESIRLEEQLLVEDRNLMEEQAKTWGQERLEVRKEDDRDGVKNQEDKE